MQKGLRISEKSTTFAGGNLKLKLKKIVHIYE